MASIKAQLAAANKYVWVDRFHKDMQPGLIVESKFGTLALGQDGWVEYTPIHQGWDTPAYPCSGCSIDGIPNSEYNHFAYYTDTDSFGRPCKRMVVPIDHPEGGQRVVLEYPNGGGEYNMGYRAGGTWVDSWWT